ncbi:helix-turn-helix domain-containing protein [Streptomyces sp. NBC_01511]|uniref:helix-turn-helix domain-containing protein n=1 Tax=Streptomyces sp. NBC_01511 TaxID=2903889 RepID=UPI00386AD150
MSIRLRTDAFRELAQTHGHLTMQQQATAAGLGIGTISRLRSGEPAGQRAVAALLTVYGVEFDDLFQVTATVPAPRKPVAV